MIEMAALNENEIEGFLAQSLIMSQRLNETQRLIVIQRLMLF